MTIPSAMLHQTGGQKLSLKQTVTVWKRQVKTKGFLSRERQKHLKDPSFLDESLGAWTLDSRGLVTSSNYQLNVLWWNFLCKNSKDTNDQLSPTLWPVVVKSEPSSSKQSRVVWFCFVLSPLVVCLFVCYLRCEKGSQILISCQILWFAVRTFTLAVF